MLTSTHPSNSPPSCETHALHIYTSNVWNQATWWCSHFRKKPDHAIYCISFIPPLQLLASLQSSQCTACIHFWDCHTCRQVRDYNNMYLDCVMCYQTVISFIIYRSISYYLLCLSSVSTTPVLNSMHTRCSYSNAYICRSHGIQWNTVQRMCVCHWMRASLSLQWAQEHMWLCLTPDYGAPQGRRSVEPFAHQMEEMVREATDLSLFISNAFKCV